MTNSPIDAWTDPSIPTLPDLNAPHLDWSADVRRQTCATPCTQPTHYVCPSRGPQEPHHLAVRGPAGAREHFCAHCGRTEKDLRDSIAGS